MARATAGPKEVLPKCFYLARQREICCRELAPTKGVSRPPVLFDGVMGIVYVPNKISGHLTGCE